MQQRMASEIILKKVDEVFMKVECDDGLARDLFDFFSFTVPNAKFMPQLRIDTGTVRLDSFQSKHIRYTLDYFHMWTSSVEKEDMIL